MDCVFADSNEEDVDMAVSYAKSSFSAWSDITPVERGNILFRFVDKMRDSEKLLAECVARETGKSLKDAAGEVQGAIAQGEFFLQEKEEGSMADL